MTHSTSPHEMPKVITEGWTREHNPDAFAQIVADAFRNSPESPCDIVVPCEDAAYAVHVAEGGDSDVTLGKKPIGVSAASILFEALKETADITVGGLEVTAVEGAKPGTAYSVGLVVRPLDKETLGAPEV